VFLSGGLYTAGQGADVTDAPPARSFSNLAWRHRIVTAQRPNRNSKDGGRYGVEDNSIVGLLVERGDPIGNLGFLSR
jgi:hypothetical protein